MRVPQISHPTLIRWIFLIFVFLLFIFLWGYYIYFEMVWNGQTPGKRWVGLRTIRADGTPAGASEFIIRNLIRLVDFLPVGYGVGLIVMFIHPQARRLGDLAAGTLVVFDRKPVSLDSVGAPTRRASFGRDVPAEMADWPLERLTRRDISLIESFLQRRWELANASAMGEQLLRRLFKRLELPPPNGKQLATAPEMLIDVLHLVRSPEERERLRQAAQPEPRPRPELTNATPAAEARQEPLTASAVARLQRVDLMRGRTARCGICGGGCAAKMRGICRRSSRCACRSSSEISAGGRPIRPRARTLAMASISSFCASRCSISCPWRS